MFKALPYDPINDFAGITIFQEGYFMLVTRPEDKGLTLAQFFDRDAPAEMAKAGMEGIQQFLVQPDQLDAILARLEQVRGQVYK